MPNEVKETADAVKAIVEAVPIYQDAVQPAAKEIGQALQVVAKTVHVALAPVSALVWGYEQIKEFVSQRVAAKLENTPAERICSPSPNVAGPALEALRYTGHDESLRDLFANLLATALDSATAPQAHPSFVEFIRQMTSDEAKIMKLVSDGRAIPIVKIRSDENENSRSGFDTFRHLCEVGIDAGCSFPELTPKYLDSLARLGLLSIHYQSTYVNSDLYKPLKEHAQFSELLAKVTSQGRYPRIVDGRAELTELGRMFCEACVLSRTTS